MGRFWGSLRRRVFGISCDETSFARRGFPGCDSPARQRLEYVAGKFVEGYLAALEDNESEPLGRRLDAFDLEARGFAFEGAAMALALLDALTPWRRTRVQVFLKGPGAAHMYMVHVGVGWALARLRRRPAVWRPRFDPLIGRLIVDGYGFHETFFNWRRYVEEQAIPDRLTGYDRRMFDQGVGRCLWFVDGADVALLAKTIASFALDRRRDLWSGVGLASAYAGGVDRRAIEALREAAGSDRPALAQGVAFAAKARQRAGNPVPHTELACTVLCGMSAADAAEITDTALEGLPPDGREPAFEVWRQRIQSRIVNLQ